jgi:hypothetical protein
VIDQQFREMVKQDPPTWDLDSLEGQYKQLDQDLSQQSMTATIKLRLDAVKRYRKIHRDYVELYKITAETRQRDAELMLQQTQFQSQLENLPQGPVTAGTDVQPAPQMPIPPPTPPQPAANPPQFDGAGIVQRMAKSFPGGPQFVLISPEGKMLSFLQSTPGIDLNRFSGRSVGVVGQRTHREDWNADVIAVRGLQAVQLRTANR